MNKHVRHIFAITRKELRSFKRRKYMLFFSIIFPTMFLGIYFIAFQSTGNSTIDIAVVNLDTGCTVKFINGSKTYTKDYNFGELLLSILNSTTINENSTEPMFNIIQKSTIDEARNLLVTSGESVCCYP